MIKIIIGYAFPVPGQKPDGGRRFSNPVNPFGHAATRTFQP
ncbi:hypothetical protein [Bradyrhizobium amphicarpaeae]|nr:hypothetical protein [Bradyrhizobium amphicarpaeae]